MVDAHLRGKNSDAHIAKPNMNNEWQDHQNRMMRIEGNVVSMSSSFTFFFPCRCLLPLNQQLFSFGRTQRRKSDSLWTVLITPCIFDDVECSINILAKQPERREITHISPIFLAWKQKNNETHGKRAKKKFNICSGLHNVMMKWFWVKKINKIRYARCQFLFNVLFSSSSFSSFGCCIRHVQQWFICKHLFGLRVQMWRWGEKIKWRNEIAFDCSNQIQNNAFWPKHTHSHTHMKWLNIIMGNRIWIENHCAEKLETIIYRVRRLWQIMA